jgi:hypothetical protein
MADESFTKPAAAAPARPVSRGGDTAMMLIELLPAWYPQTVRRRRWLKLQAALTGLLVLVFAVVLILRTEDVAASRSELEMIKLERARVDDLLAELDQSQEELAELTSEAEMLSHIGLPLEITRLFAEIERLMPEAMTLDSFTVSTIEQAPRAPEVARAKRENKPEPEATAVMQFAITGSAQSHDDIERLKKILANLDLPGEPTPKTIGSAGPDGRARLVFDLYFEVSLAAGDYMGYQKSHGRGADQIASGGEL